MFSFGNQGPVRISSGSTLRELHARTRAKRPSSKKPASRRCPGLQCNLEESEKLGNPSTTRVDGTPPSHRQVENGRFGKFQPNYAGLPLKWSSRPHPTQPASCSSLQGAATIPQPQQRPAATPPTSSSSGAARSSGTPNPTSQSQHEHHHQTASSSNH